MGSNTTNARDRVDFCQFFSLQFHLSGTKRAILILRIYMLQNMSESEVRFFADFVGNT